MKPLIPASSIEKLTLCNDIGCVTRKIEELNGTVEPDPKSGLRLQKRKMYLTRAKGKDNGTMITSQERSIALILDYWNRVRGSDESCGYKQSTNPP